MRGCNHKLLTPPGQGVTLPNTPSCWQLSPAAIWIDSTPLRAASTGTSIFIASITARVSPSLTVSPEVLSQRCTMPEMGAVTAPATCNAWGVSARLAGTALPEAATGNWPGEPVDGAAHQFQSSNVVAGSYLGVKGVPVQQAQQKNQSQSSAYEH